MMFARLGRWCARRRWTVVGLWLVVAVAAGAGLNGIGGSRTHTVFSLPDVESRAAGAKAMSRAMSKPTGPFANPLSHRSRSSRTRGVRNDR